MPGTHREAIGAAMARLDNLLSAPDLYILPSTRYVYFKKFHKDTLPNDGLPRSFQPWKGYHWENAFRKDGLENDIIILTSSHLSLTRSQKSRFPASRDFFFKKGIN